jgi:four helix bundle protein
MKITKFEDIKAWQSAREFTKEIYYLTRHSNNKQDFDNGLKDQLRRAATSVMANIAEGFDSKTDSEFIQFLKYSLRSCTEIQSHLYVIIDANIISDLKFKELYSKTVEIKNLISGFIRYLKNPNSPENKAVS